VSDLTNCEEVGTRFAGGASGTTAFNPALSDIVIEVFERCGIRAISLEPEHWQSARRSMNFVQSRWSNRGINLWKVDLVSMPLMQGQIDVPVDANVINVLDVYRSVTFGNETIDTILYPIDRSDYAGTPNKAQQGPPSSFWFQRTQTPLLKLWPAVDGAGPYILNFYVFRQMQDAIPAMGLQADAVQRFFEAYVGEVASHVAMKWAPERATPLAAYAVAVYKEANMEDHEKVSTFMIPDLSGYFRP